MFRISIDSRLLAIASLVLSTGLAHAQPGRVYINGQTGERVVFDYGARSGWELWANSEATGFFYSIDRPTRATTDVRPRFGATVNTVGDIFGPPAVGPRIGAFEVSYSTAGIRSTSSNPPACAGFDLVTFFYANDNANGSTPDTRATPLASFRVRDIPGETGTQNAWIVTYDIPAGKTFYLGGSDLDGDRRIDFGWGIGFVQGQSLNDGINSSKGMTNVALVVPGTPAGSPSRSFGVPNRLHWYSPVTFDASGNPQPRDHQSFLTSVDGTPSQYLAPYLVLYGSCGGCRADFNADGFLDFTDFDDFVGAFENGSATSDFNKDGFLDFTDFDDFASAFEIGCGC
ncbi:MAG: hypothetical protein SFY96_08080 [Planctomycetota bacterium]|nr:hypothetical protein [Planctomycetota bacterium]